MEPRKLANGYAQGRMRVWDGSSATSYHFIDVIIDCFEPPPIWWPEAEAPDKCFAADPPKPSPEEVAGEEREARAAKAYAMVARLKERMAMGSSPWVRVVDHPTNAMTGKPCAAASSWAGQVCRLTGEFGERYCVIKHPGPDWTYSIVAHNVIPLSAEDAAGIMFRQLGFRAETPV